MAKDIQTSVRARLQRWRSDPKNAEKVKLLRARHRKPAKPQAQRRCYLAWLARPGNRDKLRIYNARYLANHPEAAANRGKGKLSFDHPKGVIEFGFVDPTAPDPEESLMRAETANELRIWMRDTLTDCERAVLAAWWEADFDIPATAVELHLSEPDVRATVERIQAKAQASALDNALK